MVLTIEGQGADPTVMLLRPLLVVDVEFLGSLEILTTLCHITTHCSHAGSADFAAPLIMLVHAELLNKVLQELACEQLNISTATNEAIAVTELHMHNRYI